MLLPRRPSARCLEAEVDYGKDMKLDENRDVIFTPNGDVELQDGPRLVAQDIREELSIAFASVEWDRKAGSHLLETLNSTSADDVVVAELERVAIKDPRVDASSVKVRKEQDGRFALMFSVVGSLEDVLLLFDLEELFPGGVMNE